MLLNQLILARPLAANFKKSWMKPSVMMKPVTSPSLSDVTSVQTGAGRSMAVFARSADDSGARLDCPPPRFTHTYPYGQVLLQVRGRHLGGGALHSHTSQPKSSLSYPMGHRSGQYLARSGQESSERAGGKRVT